MKEFVILPDISCDLSQEMRDFFGITDYVHGWAHINGESLKTVLDWSLISREEFYRTLSQKKNTVTSAPASPEEYYLKFKEYAERGIDILSMSISSKISGTYNIAVSAAQRIKAEYPDVNILCFDSYRMSGAFGILVAHAALMKKDGRDMGEIFEWLEENKHRVHQMGPIDDMTFIARRGRVSPGKAFMGNLVGIKPMGDTNNDGYCTVIAKVKGIQKALRATAKYLEKMAPDIKDQYIFIMHSDREQYANELRALVEAYEPKGIFVGDVFGTCGTNIGPGMIGVYFMGEPISDECQREKEILALAINEI